MKLVPRVPWIRAKGGTASAVRSESLRSTLRGGMNISTWMSPGALESGVDLYHRHLERADPLEKLVDVGAVRALVARCAADVLHALLDRLDVPVEEIEARGDSHEFSLDL